MFIITWKLTSAKSVSSSTNNLCVVSTEEEANSVVEGLKKFVEYYVTIEDYNTKIINEWENNNPRPKLTDRDFLVFEKEYQEYEAKKEEFKRANFKCDCWNKYEGMNYSYSNWFCTYYTSYTDNEIGYESITKLDSTDIVKNNNLSTE